MNVNATFKPLVSAKQTGGEMMRIVRKRALDIGSFANWPFERWFDFVKRIPYKADPRDQETISRPRHLLNGSWPYRDCDDKAILIGSWLFLHDVPFRFVASSTKPNGQLHHVFVEVKGRHFADATYPRNKIWKLDFAHKITNFIPLTDWSI